MKRAIGLIAAVSVAIACAGPAPSSPAVAPTPSAATSAGARNDAWQPIQLPDGDGANLSGVAASAREVVIAGGLGMSPAAWVSDDAAKWTLERLSPDGAYASGVVALGDSFIATGGEQSDRCAHPGEMVFWVRDSGTWRVVAFEPRFCAGSNGTAAASRGLVAVLGTGNGDQPFAWLSRDGGSTWADDAIRPAVFPQLLAPARDGFAAVGTFEGSQWWFGRNDGTGGWTIVGLPQLPEETTAVGLVDSGRSFLVWLSTGGAVRAMSSETGVAWSDVAVRGLEGAQVQRIVPTRDGYLGIGLTTGPRLFVSRDGVAWRAIAGPEDDGIGTYEAIASLGDRAILLGTVRLGDEGVSAAWTAPASVLVP